ncbi:MAG: hypothetical protein IJ430_03215 [Parabacteroides sp.]|nr:hypothetical protein [Parabacteroides sp.]
MKVFLHIIILLLGVFFFTAEESQDDTAVLLSQVQKEMITVEEGTTDMQHHLDILSNELKDTNCLVPRRSIQTSSSTLNIRLFKFEKKILQISYLKKTNLLRKVSEEVTTFQTIKFSTLLCRMGYHIYGLRKIII